MVSKNNKVKKFEQSAQRNNHFSIRKLTVGAASVLLGTSLYLGTQTSQAHAADVAKADEKVEVVNNKTSEAEPVKDATTQTDKKAEVTTDKDQTSVAVDSLTKDAVATNQVADQKYDLTKDKTEVKSANDNTQVVKTKKAVATAATDDKNKTYHVKVTAWDDAANAPLTNVYQGASWSYNFPNGTLDVNVKDSDRIYDLGEAPLGYKLMNPEAVTDNFKMDGNAAYVNGHDVDITLHYAPLSPVYVEYVDENGKILSYTRAPGNYFSSQSIANAEGDPIYPGTSRYLVNAIDIPGYELVSAPTYEGFFDKVQSAGNENPIIVQFKYKKTSTNEDPKDIKSGATLNQQWIAPSYDYLPDQIEVQGQSGKTYAQANGDIEAKYQDLMKRYEKQGYSWIGTFNYFKNNDYYNIEAVDSLLYLIPNKPVTVYYVDKDGKQIADPTVIETNAANPDQTNDGINYANYWHAGGEWTASPKEIDGYVLDKTYGATNGKFTPYPYTVTYVYTKKETQVPTTPPVDNKEVAGVVLYIDDTTDTTLDTVKLEGEVGQKIDYNTETTIKNYEKEGYELVSSDYKNGDETFTNGSNVFEVHFKHGTEPINPNHPGIPGEPITTPEGPKYPAGTSKENLEQTVTRTITYVANGQAQDKPFVAPKTVEQTVKFTAEGILDKVTGNLVTVDAAGNITSQDGKLTWTPDSATLDAVNSPVVNYYHVVSVSADSKDNVNVDSLEVDHNSHNINVVVTYAPNGHIIPVDPNGHEIPDVPPTDLPPYPTDPTNPSKVVPNVPVPEVPGYTPDIPGKDQTVPTPPNPSDDVKVPYVKQDNPPVVNNDEVAGLVSYIDDTTGKTLASEKLEGKVGEKISYTTTVTINKYVNEGYDFVSSNFVNGDESFTSGSNVFEVHFTEGTVPVNPQKPGKPGEPLNPDDPNGNGPKYPAGTDEKSLNKTVTRTIKFVDSNGNEVANSITQSAHFTASGVLNKVTGEWVTPLTWTPDGEELSSVNVPVVEKQHVVSIDKDGNGLTSVNGVSVTHENDSYTVTVTYAPNGHIIPVDPNGEPIKNVPTPPYTTDPHNPSQVVPNEPVPEIPGYTPDRSTVTPPNPGEDTPVVYVPTTPTTPTDPNPTPEPHPEPNPDTDVPDIPAPEVPSVDVPMPHPQTPEVPEEPDETPAPHATTPETPVSEDEGEVPVVHASEVKDNDDVPMPHAAQEALPQTGEKTSVMAVIAGAFASVLGIFGLASRRKEDK